MSYVPPDITLRIEDAAAALIAAGTPNPTNDQVRTHLGGGSLSHISPVMRAFRSRLREQRTEALPLREQIARLTTTGEHLSVQQTKAELLTLARKEQKSSK